MTGDDDAGTAKSPGNGLDGATEHFSLASVRPPMEFTLVQGDIAAQSADVLVNAAGASLQMGSGVAGALRRGAGAAINEAAVSKGPVKLGGVAVTDAYTGGRNV